MHIENQIAVVTGAAGGIGRAVAARLAECGARAVAVVDSAKECMRAAEEINDARGDKIARGFCGDVCDENFRAQVFAEMESDDCARICVPAAGILRDAMAVKIARDNGGAEIYPRETFQRVLEVNLLHPVYWALHMLARIGERRHAAGLKKWQASEKLQGACIFIGSVSSRGNRGQISYAASKSALTAAAKTLHIEGMHHGVQSKIIHPGLVDTNMAAQLPEGHFEKFYLPHIPLGRMLTPREIADAVVTLIQNPAISGAVWADGGMTPMA